MPKDEVKNRIAPAYPTAAASSALPSIEMKIISTRSTAKIAINPIEAVSDITVMCETDCPW